MNGRADRPGSGLDDDEKGLAVVNTRGGEQELLTVKEPGLYRLIFKSRKPVAKRFQRWVTHDVLPSIREKGSYSAIEYNKPTYTIKDEIDVLQSCLALAGIDAHLIAGVALNHAGLRMPELKQAVNESHSLLARSLPSDVLLTPTSIGKELGISAIKVNEVLLRIGFQTLNLKKRASKESKKEFKTEPDYFVTELGAPHAGNTLATGKLQENGADNTTYQHLKWKQSIIEILRTELSQDN